MAKIIAHRELRNNSSEILRQVESGESFEITNHGKVVAMLTPVEASPDTTVGVRRATILGHFDDLPGFDLDRPIQEVLDELRGDK
jgi:prevent-host-death family protein